MQDTTETPGRRRSLSPSRSSDVREGEWCSVTKIAGSAPQNKRHREKEICQNCNYCNYCPMSDSRPDDRAGDKQKERDTLLVSTSVRFTVQLWKESVQENKGNRGRVLNMCLLVRGGVPHGKQCRSSPRSSFLAANLQGPWK